MYKFPERLKELMVEMNLNQSQLAKELNIDQSVIGRWLTNSRKPTVDSLIKLALYFKCTTDYLLGLSD